MQIWAKGELVHWIPCVYARVANILEGGYDKRLRERIVDRKDPSGPSRMVHTVCHNLGWLMFSMLPAQNFIQEYIVVAGCFFVFSLVLLSFHIAQDWKSLIKWCNPRVSTRTATSCDHWFFWLWDNGCKWSLMDCANHVSAKKSEAG
jgi:hypothetical protein